VQVWDQVTGAVTEGGADWTTGVPGPEGLVTTGPAAREVVVVGYPQPPSEQ